MFPLIFIVLMIWSLPYVNYAPETDEGENTFICGG